MGALVFVVGCAGAMVELPIDREPAALVQLGAGPVRCPAETVTYGDEDPMSGAGAVPANFDGRTVLRCETDYRSVRRRNGVDRFTINQWRTRLTPELRAAFDLPDRGFRPTRPCAGINGTVGAIYLVDGKRQAIRVLLPSEDPCHQVRPEVARLLLSDDSSLDATFHASRKII
jgi:hypothetical protein